MKGRQLKLSEAAAIVENGGKVIGTNGSVANIINDEWGLKNILADIYVRGPYYEYIDEEQSWKDRLGHFVGDVSRRDLEIIIEESCRRMRAELKEKGVL